MAAVQVVAGGLSRTFPSFGVVPLGRAGLMKVAVIAPRDELWTSLSREMAKLQNVPLRQRAGLIKRSGNGYYTPRFDPGVQP